MAVSKERLSAFNLINCQRLRLRTQFSLDYKNLGCKNLSICCNWTRYQGWELMRHCKSLPPTWLVGDDFSIITHHLSKIFWVSGCLVEVCMRQGQTLWWIIVSTFLSIEGLISLLWVVCTWFLHVTCLCQGMYWSVLLFSTTGLLVTVVYMDCVLYVTYP